MREYLSIIRDGLRPHAVAPKRVVIIGAGMAGLSAAYELLRAGHDPILLEAQNRVGGRVYTLRTPFTDGLYAEAGAMRIPRAHCLTHAYIDKFGLRTSPFTMGNPNTYHFLNGRKTRIKDETPESLGCDVNSMWRKAIDPLVNKLAAHGDSAWDELVPQYDQYCLREFLCLNGWTKMEIETFGLVFNQEAQMNASFLEYFRWEAGNFFTDLVEIAGGMDRLPHAFLPELRGRIRFGARMTTIDQSENGVTVSFETGAGRFQQTADLALITIPFPVLRHIEILKPFSRGKQKAIRQLRYAEAAKVLFQCRRRFWEEDEGIYGGGTLTDLPIRTIYYPEHHRETGRGVLLASYTWSADAQRWGSLSHESRVRETLEDVAQVHPQILTEFECAASHVWHQDEFAGGAFANFEPEQQSLFYNDMITPEGRIHFAGEHTSLTHAWIQGAIESGLRAALEIHSR